MIADKINSIAFQRRINTNWNSIYGFTSFSLLLKYQCTVCSWALISVLSVKTQLSDYSALSAVTCADRLIQESIDTITSRSQKLQSSVLMKEMTAKTACATALTTKYHYRTGDAHVIPFCFRTLNACSTARRITTCKMMVMIMRTIRDSSQHELCVKRAICLNRGDVQSHIELRHRYIEPVP